MFSTLIQTSALLLSLHLIATTLRSWHKLRDFPGPRLASFSNLWLFVSALSGKAYLHRMDLRRKYGRTPPSPVSSGTPVVGSIGISPLIRIGPDTLITDDPAIFKRINSPHGGYVRGDWYAVMRLDPYQDTLIASMNNKFHDDIRARTAAGITGREVPGMEDDIDGVVWDLITLIESKYISSSTADLSNHSSDGTKPLKSSRPMDWAPIAQYFTLDALTKVAYRKDFGHLKTDSDVFAYLKTLQDMTLFIAVCSDIPWLGKIFLNKLSLWLIGPKVTDTKGAGAVMGVAKEVVGQRFETDPTGTEHQDMLSSFIRHGLPRRQCEAELPSQFVAGSDTTANILRIGLFMAATTPRVSSAIRREIDEAVRSNRVSSPIASAEAKKLPYLQAFIWETLRLNPPVSLLFPKIVPPTGDTLGGKFVPSGTKIGVDFWSMGRCTDIFGDDPDTFRPERFLEASAEKRDMMEKTTDLIFGYGRYRCLGRNMAWMEMEKVFVELVNPEVPFIRTHYALFLIKDMYMVVTKRQQ
ncbi:cytochrome P450 [Rhypophila decipiens]|uniref:Cytochrome P450 n=1 Tax=Rhypophila decipiens TaxID=261697 RepID=A0AAN7BDH0_9PEZI|nr:cytochrome P450 [Rhypophila decipiens]